MFQFTHPVWGATRINVTIRGSKTVSIHAPRVGCDYKMLMKILSIQKFQFTHPVWGATAMPKDTHK